MEQQIKSEPLNEQYLREKLVVYGKKLVESGLVQGTWGNISIRLDIDHMIITPSGLDYERLTPDDMVKVNINTLEHEGSMRPSSEKGLHAEIYKNRQDVGAVIHTHSKYSCVYAAANKEMPVLDEYKSILGNEIKLAAYALAGTKALAKNTASALGKNAGAILANHGMVACGTDIENAFEKCEAIEENGKKTLT